MTAYGLATVAWALLLSVAAVAQERSSHVALDFDSTTGIDEVAVNARERSKPFTFDMVDLRSRRAIAGGHFTADIGTDFHVWLDPRIPPASAIGSRSLAVKITSPVDANNKDKILFSPVMHNSIGHMDVEGPERGRYISFDFMLADDYETPNTWAIHLQAFQCCGGHPPFTIQVVPSPDKRSPVVFTFNVIDDVIERARSGAFRELFRVVVPRGAWHHLALFLKPGPIGDGPGGVTMWFDGSQRFSYAGHWGFRPDGINIHDAIGLDLGIYRRRQRTTQTILFGHVRTGSSITDVQP